MGPISFLVALLAIVVIVVFIVRTRRRMQLGRRLGELRSTWGVEPQRERNIQALREFHQVYPHDNARDEIDDHTWMDLNLDEIFTKIDRSFTTAGEFMLYQMLHAPLISQTDLAARSRMIRALQDNRGLREMLQLELLNAGRSDARSLISLIWTKLRPPTTPAWHFKILAICALLALVFAFILQAPIGLIAVILMFVVNMKVHYSMQRQYIGRMAGLRQLRMLIRAATATQQLNAPEFADSIAVLRQSLSKTGQIASRVGMLPTQGTAVGDIFGGILEYISIYFLEEVRIMHSVMVDVIEHQDDLRAIFRTVGELDALQSVASFRAGLSGYSEPQFIEDGARLEIQDARHPLLVNPVPNSIEISAMGVAITGSNMSGKTTFLKTIGVNVLLAQTIHTCLATSYRARFLRIISSMNEADDLLEGKSYYLAEAERLLTMVRRVEGPELILCLIDEPLAGTNSPERLAASREILRYLASHNGLVMVSTHDVGLVSQIQDRFSPFHFTDQADDRGIRFDYRLRQGLDYHGNAIKVLKYIGFPDAIIQGAMKSLVGSGN